MPKCALLPLYLKLYDDAMPQMRSVLDPWLDEVAGLLQRQGIEIVRLPVCRIASEFAAAVRSAEIAKADAIFTIHLAYSPSLEAADALAATRLPIVMIDTTMDADFGRDVDPGRLLYNHGVHGVQDLANLLRRRGKQFEIVAGHYKAGVLERAADLARAATAACRMRNASAVRVGPKFAGMGDFDVADEVLSHLAVGVTQLGVGDLAKAAAGVTAAAIEQEVELDRSRYEVLASPEAHRRSVRVGLALRRCLDDLGATALSANFQAFNTSEGPIDTMPFLELSKAMARGVGYAGEGDVLTAALVSGLLAGWPRSTFAEIFCADWKGGSLFLSHMGEVNPAVAAARPQVHEKDLAFLGCRPPAVLTCAPAAGKAVLVNLAPQPGCDPLAHARGSTTGVAHARGSTTGIANARGSTSGLMLIVAPVDVLGDGTHAAVASNVRGWIRPRPPVAEFLERYSLLGGTHHSGLVLGDHVEAIAAFGRMAGLDVQVLQ